MVTNKKYIDTKLWASILDFNVKMDMQLTTKANFFFGASTLIAVFIIGKLVSYENFNNEADYLWLWIILLIGSTVSSLLAVMVVLPKIRIFSKKERIKKDIFYYKNILKYYSRESYAKYIKALPNDEKLIGDAYANQVYSLANNIIPYKSRMLKISGWTLIISIMISVFIYLIII